MVVKAEAAKAMACLDEIIFDDIRANPKELDDHLKEAEWHAQAILNGGSDWENTYQAVTTPTLIEENEELIASLERYKESIESSVDAKSRHMADPSLDPIVDSLYAEVQAKADELEESLQDSWKSDQAKFKSLEIALISSCVILGFLIFILLIGYEKSRAATLVELQGAS